MPNLKSLIITLAAILGFSAPAHADDTLPKIRIIMVGDSTMTNKSGYGTGFCDQFRPEVTCINAARGGRSSKSYRVEGLWDAILTQLNDKQDFAATYVWIGFGHNDGSSRPERHTDIVTEFPLNMRGYGKDIVKAGAVPIFVTPLTQRHFRERKLQNDLTPWANAMRLEARNGGYVLVDVYAESQRAVQEMGLVEANTLAGQPIPQNILDTQASGTSVRAVFTDASQNGASGPQAFDYTHTGPKGSAYFGRLAVQLWVKADPRIRAYVKP